MTDSNPQPSLSQRINIATRPLHTQLNASIISLLPLALPPHTLHPNPYSDGISHILPIYEAIEGAFRVLQAWSESEKDNRTNRVLLEALKDLPISQLARANRLKKDIERLCQQCTTKTSDLRNFHETRRNNCPKLKHFVHHIKTSISDQIHLLLPYTWILYMALFSGGRYIRSTLQQAGPEFWLGPEKRNFTNVDDVLSFWTFEGDEDGKDIQKEFKHRFAEVEALLTEEQKQEVVQEGKFIMNSMGSVVQEIAEVVGTNCSKIHVTRKSGGQSAEMTAQQQPEYDPSMQQLLLKHILPMGMVELIAGAASLVQGALRPWYQNIASVEAEVP
ncbi:hypothetical protein ACLMJK_009736 [Lecanora helva]